MAENFIYLLTWKFGETLRRAAPKENTLDKALGKIASPQLTGALGFLQELFTFNAAVLMGYYNKGSLNSEDLRKLNRAANTLERFLGPLDRIYKGIAAGENANEIYNLIKQTCENDDFAKMCVLMDEVVSDATHRLNARGVPVNQRISILPSRARTAG